MTERLHIGKGIYLPLDFVTKTQAILARKRSGKSYTAQKQAEQLLEHGQQIAALDPTGAWWGLRSSADGASEGYPVVVFGGEHQDAPLNPSSGTAMARALVEHGFSAIYDLGEMNADEQADFAAAFCSELYKLNRKAMHLFIDEADVFAPQKTMSRNEKLSLHAVRRLVKMGGVRGIGCTMITQRPAVLNKDVLTQVDIITALRMSHPADIQPVYDWLASEVDPKFAKEVREALPALPTGTGYMASSLLGIAQKIEVAPKVTFNSGATPKPGEVRVEPKVLAKIDIVKLGEQIAASVEEAKENSVEHLKEKIRQLEAQIENGGTANMGVLEDVQRMEQELAELRPLRDQVATLEQEVMDRRRRLGSFIDRVKALVTEFENGDAAWESWRDSHILVPIEPLPAKASAATTPPSSPSVAPLPSVASTPRHYADGEGEYTVNGQQQQILDAMATLYAIRNAKVTLEWIACTAGTTARARGFEENMRILKKHGLVDGIRLTERGARIARAATTPPTFRAVLERLQVRLSTPQVDILRYLKASRRTPDELASLCETTVRARGFEENVRQLKSRELIFLNGGHYHLVDWLAQLP